MFSYYTYVYSASMLFVNTYFHFVLMFIKNNLKQIFLHVAAINFEADVYKQQETFKKY